MPTHRRQHEIKHSGPRLKVIRVQKQYENKTDSMYPSYSNAGISSTSIPTTNRQNWTLIISKRVVRKRQVA